MRNNVVVDCFKAEMIRPLNSDYGICDAARVSLAKMAAQYNDGENGKLLKHLMTHGHWSPYGHARDIFYLSNGYMTPLCWLAFFDRANLAGFTWERSTSGVFVSGSMWAFYENLWALPVHVAEDIRDWYHKNERYRMSAPLLFRKPVSFGIREVDLKKSLRSVAAHDARGMEKLASASFRVSASIFMARQMVKHQIHLCWNEESRRYIDDPPQFFVPIVWRARPDKSIKQGSKDSPAELTADILEAANNHYIKPAALYNVMIEQGCAPELARMVLPQSAITNWIWTGTIDAWKRVCNLRMDGHAQKEAQQLGSQINTQLAIKCPVMWESLNKEPSYIERG